MPGRPNSKYIITERRQKVHIMLSQGLNETEIATQLNVNQSTICRDVKSIKKHSQDILQVIEREVLPYEYSNCLQGLQEIIKEVWIILENADKTGERLQSLALIKEIFVTRMDLLTNASLLQDSIKFVEQIKDKLSNNNKKEVNKQDNGMEGFTETDWTAESTDTVF